MRARRAPLRGTRSAPCACSRPAPTTGRSRRDAGRPTMLDPRRLVFTHDWGTGGEDDRSLGARIIGGCSAHNACVAVHGSPADYDEWGAEWSWARFAPCLERAMETLRTAAVNTDHPAPFHEAFVEAAQAAGFPLLDDPNDPAQPVGVARVPRQRRRRHPLECGFRLPRPGARPAQPDRSWLEPRRPHRVRRQARRRRRHRRTASASRRTASCSPPARTSRRRFSCGAASAHRKTCAVSASRWWPTCPSAPSCSTTTAPRSPGSRATRCRTRRSAMKRRTGRCSSRTRCSRRRAGRVRPGAGISTCCRG